MAHKSEEYIDEKSKYGDVLQSNVEKGVSSSMSQNAGYPISNPNYPSVRSRTPDLNQMPKTSNGNIENSKTAGNLQLDLYNIDSLELNRDHNTKLNQGNNFYSCNANEEQSGLADRLKEIKKSAEENILKTNYVADNLESHMIEDNGVQQCRDKQDITSSTSSLANRKNYSKKRSQSQSPPSPKKLPSTKSETTISPKNDFTDADSEVSNQSNCIQSSSAVYERKSNNSLQFELGPPNESFTGKLEVGLGGNSFDSNDNSSGCLNRTDYSGPASLDLTKDISANGLRPKHQNQSFDEKVIRHSQTVSENSSRIGKNNKHLSSNSSSNSSGNCINYSTGSSSLISIASQTSNSVDVGAQNISTSLKPGKKKSWYNALYPTYKSRADDFKKIFSALPQEEKLIVEYSCALQRDILVHGRLYVTRNYLCFYANIFRWETSVALRWKDVVSITKEKTALVIPNAIQICTENDERHFFTSFAARDRTYMMLFKLWQNALLDQPASSSEIWRWVHSVYGDELGLTSEDDADYVRPTRMTLSSLNDIADPLSTNDNSSSRIFCTNLKDQDTDNGNNTNYQRKSRTNYMYDYILTDEHNIDNKSTFNNLSPRGFQRHSKSQEPTANNHNSNSCSEEVLNDNRNEVSTRSHITTEGDHTDNFSEDDSLDNVNISDVKTSPKVYYGKQFQKSHGHLTRKQQKTTSQYNEDHCSDTELSITSIETALASWKSTQEGREIISQVFPVSVDELFSLLFNDSKFYNEFQESRKTFDMAQNDWHPSQKDNIHYSKTREVSFTLSLTHPMGPKHSRVTETQQMRRESEAGHIYFIDVDTVNAGIPYADSFYVELTYCITSYGSELKKLEGTNWRSKANLREAQLFVFASIKYKKTVWGLVKTFIEKNTWAGLEEFFQNLAQSLHNECEGKSLKEKICSSKHTGLRVERKSKDHFSERQNFGASQDRTEGNSEESTQNFKIDTDESDSNKMLPKIGPSKAPQPASRNRPKSLSHSEQHQKGKAVSQNYIANLIKWFFSILSSLTFNEFLVKVILTLLTGLLLSNSVLFYKLWVLEERLLQAPENKEYFDFLGHGQSKSFGTVKDFGYSNNEDEKGFSNEDITSNNIHSVKSNTDWLKLLHRQEVAHQLELEKWHAILGAATDLLRQTEQSLTNLQRNIHPLAIKNLRNLLDFHNNDWSIIMNELQEQSVHKGEQKNTHNKQNTDKVKHSNYNQEEPSIGDHHQTDTTTMKEDL